MHDTTLKSAVDIAEENQQRGNKEAIWMTKIARTFLWLIPTYLVFLVSASPMAVLGSPNTVDYYIEATLDEKSRTINGREIVTVTNNSGRALPELWLHLYQNAYKDKNTELARSMAKERRFWEDLFPGNLEIGYIEVSRVMVGRAEKEPEELLLQESAPGESALIELAFEASLAFEVSGTRMRLPLPEPLAPEDALTLQITFTTKLPGVKFTGGYLDGNYGVSLWYPKVAVYDEKGWHTDELRIAGEFYSDFGDYTVALTIPRDLVVGASGRLVNSTPNPDGSKTELYQAKMVRDFAWAADRNYKVVSAMVNGTELRALYRNEKAARDALALGRSAFEYFSARFGAYPYPVFTIAEVAAADSFEFPGIVFMGHGGLFGLPIFDYGLVHEVAHQWWYGVVGNDEQEEAALDEGLATFATLRFAEDTYPSGSKIFQYPAALSWLPNVSYREMQEALYRERIVGNDEETAARPAWAFRDKASYKSSVYGKTALVYEMLRYYLGAEKFDSALAAFYDRYKFSNASLADLEKQFSEVAGEDLGWFFKQWFSTTRRLDYAVVSVQRSGGTAGATGTTVARIERVGEAFMPVEISFTMDDGSRKTLRYAEKGKYGFASVEGLATRVEIDPNHAVLDVNRENNVWPAIRGVSLKLFPSVVPENGHSLTLWPVGASSESVSLALFEGIRLPMEKQWYVLTEIPLHGDKSPGLTLAGRFPVALRGMRGMSAKMNISTKGDGDVTGAKVGLAKTSNRLSGIFPETSTEIGLDYQGTREGPQSAIAYLLFHRDTRPVYGLTDFLQTANSAGSLRSLKLEGAPAVWAKDAGQSGQNGGFVKLSGEIEESLHIGWKTDLVLRSFVGAAAGQQLPSARKFSLRDAGAFSTFDGRVDGLLSTGAELRFPLLRGFGVKGVLWARAGWAFLAPDPAALIVSQLGRTQPIMGEAGFGLRQEWPYGLAFQANLPLYSSSGAGGFPLVVEVTSRF